MTGVTWHTAFWRTLCFGLDKPRIFQENSRIISRGTLENRLG